MDGIIETRPSEVKRWLVHWLHRVICHIVFLYSISYGQCGRDKNPRLGNGLASELLRQTEAGQNPAIDLDCIASHETEK